MIRRFLIATLLSVIPASATAQFPSDSAVRSIIRDRVDSRRSTGIVVGLLEPDGRTHIVAYNERAHGEPVFDEQTIFEIGSITKAFTGALLADMVARGEVKLDDPVAKFLPGTVRMPARGTQQITLLDLATQSSALPRMPDNFKPADPTNPYADYTVQQMYDFLSGHTLRRDIGTEYEYSNLGFGLLGHALALRAGKSYEALVRERILQPFGMTSTTIGLSPDQKARLAPGHNPAGTITANWDIPALASAGALRSSVADMLKFLAANLDSTNVVGKRIRAAHTARRSAGSPTMDIGLGWHIMKRPTRTLIWHNGGTGGYRSFAGFDPASRRGVVVLTNSAIGSDDIGFHLLDATLPLAAAPKPVAERKEVTVSAETLERYVGQYELGPNFIFTVIREEDRLFGQATGQQRVRLWAESDTDFFLKEVDAQIKFMKDAQGAVTALTLFQGGRTMVAQRLR